MLHRGDQHLIARADVRLPVRLRYEIERSVVPRVKMISLARAAFTNVRTVSRAFSNSSVAICDK